MLTIMMIVFFEIEPATIAFIFLLTSGNADANVQSLNLKTVT